MKKMMMAAMILAVSAAGLQSAKAGDREWAVVGKILTGAIVVDAIAHTLPPPAPVYATYSAPVSVYCPPAPRVCAPVAPCVVVHRAPVCVTRPVVCVAPPAVNVRFGAAERHQHFRHGRR